MKCMVVANCTNKSTVLDVAMFSVEQKEKNGQTYLWYEDDFYANEDAADLKANGIDCVIKTGWENDGFVNFCKY